MLDTNPTPDRSYNREDLHWYEESWKANEDTITPEANFYLDLFDTIRKGTPLVITPESVRKRIAVLDKCHKICGL